MSFPEAFLEQVKSHFRLSEYIGRTVSLKRAGKELVGLSPFNREKTPSFYVNDDKAMFFDFSSGKTGDLFDWLAETERLSFVEAVKRLAQEAGIAVPEGDARSAARELRTRQLRSILEAAQGHFRNNLLHPRHGAEARAYLERRGLTPADWERFGIGYALDGNAHLREHLIRDLNLEQVDIIAAGLLATTDDGRPPYDRFRNRITFPIFDVAGRPISFGGRALAANARSKYLNGSETEIFDKGRHLYGLNEARRILAAGTGPLLVVEGYMDVIACQRAGIAACATMGTSLTDQQLDLMWRHHPEPTLCFDGDAAGRRAAQRAMDMAIPKLGAGRSLRFTAAIGGKDPDDVLRTQGADALRRQLVKATPLADAIFHREYRAGPLDTPEQRAALRERLRKIVNTIPDRGLGREYAERFRKGLEVQRERPAASRSALTTSMDSARALRTSAPPGIAALAYWLVRDPERAGDVIEDLSTRGLGHPVLDEIAAEVVGWLMSGRTDGEGFAQHLHSRGFGETVARLADPGQSLACATDWRRAYQHRSEYLRLEAELQAAKQNINTPGGMERFIALKVQRDEAKRAL